MLQPGFLKQGSTIGIAAPAGVINPLVLEESLDYLRSKGYQLKLGKSLLDNHFQFAATDQKRLQDMQNLMNDPEVEAIIAARGGYGALRILPQLSFDSFLKKPKWVCGFSDITAIHCKLAMYGIQSIHSGMLASFTNKHQDLLGGEALLQMLSGQFQEYDDITYSPSRNGKVKAPVIGGNLSILYALRGTPYEPDVKGKILFIEDIGEQLYHLDRMLMNLKMGGWFDDIAGLIVGYFTDMKDHELGFGMTAEEIIASYISEYKYPVLFNFPAGHELPNFPLILGREVILDVDSVWTVRIL